MPQRSTVTISFCDLVGSTALLSQIGDIANDEVRRDLFAALRAPLAMLGGEEIKTQGDGLMAAFRGRPSDAIACAVAWQQATAALSRRDPSYRLELRVGVSMGEATFEEHDWFGTPVVEAARLCGAAAAGQILVSESVRLVVGDDAAIDFEPVGALELKGLVGRRAACAIRWTTPPTRAVVPRPPGFELTGVVPFAGRARELELCAAIASAADTTRRRCVLVAGPAGAGKSRLLAEALRDVEHTVLRGTWDGRGAHQGSAEALRWYSAAIPGDQLRAVLGDDGPLVAALVPAIGLRVPELAAAESSSSASADELIAAFARIFGRIASDEPTVLAFEDLHAASPEGLALFLELATARRVGGAVVFGTFRTDDRGEVPRSLAVVLEKLAAVPEVERIDLGPLDVTDVAVMAGDVAIDADAVHAATEGNPRRIVDTVRRVAAGGDPAVALSRAMPFKGLITFDAADRELFFGRDDAIASLLGRLANDRLIAVVGTSGSGKSSLVRAGVVAAVEGGRLPGRWSTSVLSPGSDPEAALASALATITDGTWLVVVDQLEECVTRCHDEAARTRFLEALLETATDPDRDVRVVATVRADLLGAVVAASPRFATAVESGAFFLGPMSDAELRAVIEGPAEAVGLRLEPGFVDVVVGDVLGQPGALPLLSHALLETWKRRRGSLLTIDNYRESGGTRGAIARSADLAFESLTGPDQVLARELFLRLTELGEGTEDSRRRVEAAEAATLGPPEVVDALVEHLTVARLLTVDELGIEVAHEALIREWPRLRSWLDESRDDLRRSRELQRRATEWDRSGRPDSELLRGARLDQALDRATDDPASGAGSVVADYLESARSLRERETRDAVRRVRRLRAALAATIALALIATAAGVAARGQQRRADDRAREAASLAELAEVRRAAAEAIAASDGNLALALPLAVEAFSIDDRFETRHALLSAVQAEPALIGLLPGPPGGYTAGAISGDGSVGAFAHAGGVDLWDLRDRTLSATLPADAPRFVAYLADGRLVTGSNDGVDVWSPPEPTPVLRIDEPATSIAELSDGLAVGGPDGALVLFDHDGVELARTRTGRSPTYVVSDGDALLVASGEVADAFSAGTPAAAGIGVHDPRTLELRGDRSLVPGDAVVDLALSPDHLTVAAGSSTWFAPSYVRLDDQIGRNPTAAFGILGDASQVAFIDASTAISGGVTGRLQAGVTGGAGWELRSQVGSTSDLVVSPDGATVWALGAGAMGWSVERARATTTPSSDAAVVPYAISPDGRYLLAAEDRTSSPPPQSLPADPNEPQVGTAVSVSRLVHVLDTTTLAPVIEPIDGIPIGFLADSEHIVVSATSVVPEIVDLATGERSSLSILANVGGDDRPWRIAPDGARLADAADDGTVRLIEPASGAVLARELGRADAGPPSLVAYGSSEVLAVAYDATETEAASVVVHRGSSRSTVAIGADATALAIDDDGTILAVGGVDGAIRLFDTRSSGGDPAELVGPTGRVTQLDLRPDGRQLVSTSTDGTARVFDLDARRMLGEPIAASSDAQALYGGGGAFVFLATPHGPDRIDLDPAAWVETACSLAGANLPLSAWERFWPTRSPRPTCPRYDPPA